MPYSFSINRYASISEWNSGDEITTNFVISFQLFYAYSSYFYTMITMSKGITILLQCCVIQIYVNTSRGQIL